jgi:hypothetical protein
VAHPSLEKPRTDVNSEERINRRAGPQGHRHQRVRTSDTRGDAHEPGCETPRRTSPCTRVYDRCSRFAAFREGARLRADVQFNKRLFSNVEVDLATTKASAGHTIWYQVFFKSGPASFAATKEITAKLCRLPDKNIEVEL